MVFNHLVCVCSAAIPKGVHEGASVPTGTLVLESGKAQVGFFPALVKPRLDACKIRTDTAR